MDPLYRRLEPVNVSSHATFRGYAVLLESLNDASIDDAQAALIRGKTVQYIFFRRLMLFELIQCRDSAFRSRADVFRLLLLGTEELVIEDDLGFHMMLNALPQSPFLRLFPFLQRQLVSCWATLEKKVFAARLRCFTDATLVRLLSGIVPGGVQETNLAHAARSLVASFSRAGVSMKTDASLRVQVNAWLASIERFSEMEISRRSPSKPGKRKRAAAPWFLLTSVPLPFLRAIASHELQRHRSFSMSPEWNAAKRHLFLDFSDGSVLGGISMLRAVCNAIFVAYVMPRRAVGCSCPPQAGTVRACAECDSAVALGWNARKNSLEAGYAFTRSFVDSMHRTLSDRYASWDKRLLMRYAGLPVSAKTTLLSQPEFLPPCMQRLAAEPELDPGAVELFDASLARDVSSVSKANRAEAKAQREHAMRRVFGSHDPANEWSCAGMCARNLCPVRLERDALEIDVAYTQRCHARMKETARRHLRIEFEEPATGRRRGVTRDGFEFAPRIETPVDFTLSLLYLQWQKRGGPFSSA